MIETSGTNDDFSLPNRAEVERLSTEHEQRLEISDDLEVPFPVVNGPTRELLTEKEAFDYEYRMRRFARWMLAYGKGPREYEGYAADTAQRTLDRLSLFDRRRWDNGGEFEYDSVASHEDAGNFVEAEDAAVCRLQDPTPPCLRSSYRGRGE